jgi:hypothetical protein
MPVVCLFEQAGLDLAKIGFHIRLAEPKDPEGNWFDEPEIAFEALRDTGILDLDRILPPLKPRPVYLTD